VIDQRAMRAVCGLAALVSLVCFRNLHNGSAMHLCRQAEPLADVVAGQLLQVYFARALLGRRGGRAVVTGSVEGLQRARVRSVLLRCRGQLEERGLFHMGSVAVLRLMSVATCSLEAAHSPAPQGGGHPAPSRVNQYSPRYGQIS